MEKHNIKFDTSECEACAEVNHVIAFKTPETPVFLIQYGREALSLALLLFGLLFDHFIKLEFFFGYFRLLYYVVAYVPVAFPVIKKGFKLMLKGEVFTEFFLMSIATLGAFALGQYPEGVAVMLFYAIGELFQSAAVNRAKRNIKDLLDIIPDRANLLKNGMEAVVKPELVKTGSIIRVKAGERVPLDGEIIEGYSSFNTAALTGESVPQTIREKEVVLASMINLDRVVDLRVTKNYSESSIARILDMVQNASARKAPSELFIRKFAKVYTPIVVYLALTLVFLPYFFATPYVFADWFYRGLIFLVISCPCALVISIPLGYFGGIGAASHNGILFKGSNYLDQITKVNTMVMDKTGTLTKGVFKVQAFKTLTVSEKELFSYAGALEIFSTHPVAKAILNYVRDRNGVEIDRKASGVQEIAGLGIKGYINGKVVLAGNAKLLQLYDVDYPKEIDSIVEAIVLIAVDQVCIGYFIVADELKEDALITIKSLKDLGVEEFFLLSGDKQSIVQKVMGALGIKNGYGELLPEGKVKVMDRIKADRKKVVAFAGDGINDAPVLALSDVGIAMGALGSDAAIETADIVIQADHPSKIATAIKIGRETRKIVWQNIALAMGIKVLVLLLGAGGLATLWEAVFADVGVALLAILNAVRIQRMQFH